MVFYFKARPDAGDYTIYMGADKNENEELIKYGLPEDVWFHVDKVSSAHVYLRLKKGDSIDTISEGLLEDCAQLVKAHSIQGNKMNNVEVVYTPWSNLKKATSMDVGQVGFHNHRLVHVLTVEKRVNEILNRLNKTRVERRPDLKAEKDASNAAEKAERKMQLKDKARNACMLANLTFPNQSLSCMKRREEMERVVKERQAEIRSYKGLMVAEKMTSNRQIASAGKSIQEMEDEFV
uniref:NFACT RNA-binding domain-containing protein n=1 Tax=Aegilops tauschii TaxID=37682 RepID=M8C220_AEGTA